jgi:glycosyltransferase involved in cell wall biosynthesis
MAIFFIAAIHGRGTLFRYFHALGSELATRGHRVVIIIDGRALDEVDETGNPSVVTWPSVVPTRWRDAIFLRSLIKRFRPQCIISNFSAVNICSVIGFLYGVQARAAWGRTLSSQIEMDTSVARWKRFLLNTRRRLVYRFSTHLIANSRAMRADMIETFHMPFEKIEIINSLFHDPPYDPARPRERRIVFVGRMSPSKGIDVLLHALVRVNKACPDVTVEFIGDGPVRRRCEELADSLGVGGMCRFVGAVPIEEVYERLSTAALQVTPSIHEAFGNINVEGHSVGLPVVASDVDGISEVVLDGETGLLVPPGDQEALADGIIKLMRDDEMRERFGRAARAHFERRFSVRHIARQADFFESLVKDS